MCIESEVFEVQVPACFLGTEGFSLRRDGHYFALQIWKYLNIKIKKSIVYF